MLIYAISSKLRCDITSDKLEELKKDNIEEFVRLITLNKKIYQKCVDLVSYDDLKELEELFMNEKYKAYLFWAVNKGIFKAVERKDITLLHFFLVKCGVRLDNPVHRRVLFDLLNSVKGYDFLEMNENVNYYVEITKLLITFGADVDFEENNETPLSIAVKFKMIPMIIILIKDGANVDWKDNDGMTVKDYCAKKSDEVEFEEILRIIERFEGQ